MKQKELRRRASNIQWGLGAAIEGEKITAQARKVYRSVISTGTSSHQIQQIKLEGSAFCIIDRPLNFLRDLPEKAE